MQIKINKTQLLKPLAKVQSIATTKTNLSITQSVLIRAEQDSITIESTDLGTGYTGKHDAVVDGQCAFAVNAKKLFEIVHNFPDEEILFDYDDNWLKIEGKGINYQLLCSDADAFPEAPVVKDIEYEDVNATTLERACKIACSVVTDSADGRAHIKGAYFCDGDIVSTDGNRLALSKGVTAKGIAFSGLVPKKSLNDLTKFIGTSESVLVGFKDNFMSVKKNDGSENFLIRLLEGEFPHYDGVIKPADGADKILINRADFMAALKRVSIISSDIYKGVVSNFDGSRIKITATNPDLGDCKEEMFVENNLDLEAGYNPKFIIDAMSFMPGDNVVLNIKNETTPMIIHSEIEDNFSIAIMPMRI